MHHVDDHFYQAVKNVIVIVTLEKSASCFEFYNGSGPFSRSGLIEVNGY